MLTSTWLSSPKGCQSILTTPCWHQPGFLHTKDDSLYWQHHADINLAFFTQRTTVYTDNTMLTSTWLSSPEGWQSILTTPCWHQPGFLHPKDDSLYWQHHADINLAFFTRRMTVYTDTMLTSTWLSSPKGWQSILTTPSWHQSGFLHPKDYRQSIQNTQCRHKRDFLQSNSNSSCVHYNHRHRHSHGRDFFQPKADGNPGQKVSNSLQPQKRHLNHTSPRETRLSPNEKSKEHDILHFLASLLRQEDKEIFLYWLFLFFWRIIIKKSWSICTKLGRGRESETETERQTQRQRDPHRLSTIVHVREKKREGGGDPQRASTVVCVTEKERDRDR